MAPISAHDSPTKVVPMYIDGVWRTGSDAETADDFNPATGQVFAKVAQAGAADVEDAIAAAHRARVSWGKMLAGQQCV